MITKANLREWVPQDRIHGRVFTEPEVFSLEMRRIFGRVWVFVGHESQVPNPGDFFTTRIGLQPVVMTRHTDRSIHVLYNRCAHRGAKVLNTETGNALQFQCMYHGWTYGTDGALVGCPMKSIEVRAGFDFGSLRMESVAQTDSIHGLIFAKLTPGGPTLSEYLGPVVELLDEFMLMAPEGELEFNSGCHRYEFQGNWKHQLEQAGDHYHILATHRSTLNEEGRQFKRRPGESGTEARLDEDGQEQAHNLGVWVYPNGHVACETLFSDEQKGGAWDEWKAALALKYGSEERAREVLRHKFHSIVIFPSFSFVAAQSAVRVYQPISVDKTEIRIFPFKMKGIPDEVYREQLRYVNLTHSAASFIQSDDTEAFRRVQEGLAADFPEWCLATRGMTRDKFDNRGIGFGDKTSEIGQRHQHNTWLELMCCE